jgi:hypothetical protein
MALSKKYGDVYDGIKHKTPMQKMLEEQEARRKALEEKESKDDNKPSRKQRSNNGTSK